MGKQRPRKDNYWDSDQFEKDREDAEKLERGEEVTSSSESEEDKPVKPTKGGNKKAAAQPKKQAVAASGKKKQQQLSSESESESEEEKPVKKGNNNNNKNNNKKPQPQTNNKKKQQISSESESESSEEEPVKPTKGGAKKQAASTKKPVTKKQVSSESESESEESESESESSEEEKKTTKVTQQPTKPTAKPAKPTAKGGKKAAAQNKKQEVEEPKLSGFLLKQKQEEERIQREKDEKKKREEEEKARKEQQRIIDEEKARIKSIEKSKRKNEKREKEAVENKEKERLEKLAKLGVTLPPTTGDAAEKKKVVYAAKKKQPKANSVAQVTEAIQKVSIDEEKKEEEEVAENWDDDDWETIDEKEKKKEEEEKKKEEEEERKRKEEKAARKAAKADKKPSITSAPAIATAGTSVVEEKVYRSPIICILGHVDTGKTSLLDKIRHTNVQGGEARGITQQIGASFIPVENIKEQTKAFAEKVKMEFKLPGLLLIDTPGHESFNNLRSRGSGLCDFAILVIDIMHGLEAQTIESINLLRMRKTPFIVALNKVDRIYDWKPCVNTEFKEAIKLQSRSAAQEFDSKVKETIAALAGQELNAELYWRNKDIKNYVSLVPTSAHTGEGISDLMLVVMQLMQKRMIDKVVFTEQLQCTLLEVKVIEGYGTTIDVILVNGSLNEGDKIVVSGFNGPIETTIRSLLTPPPLRESRIKSQYIQLKSIRAAMGVKIVAPGLEKAVPGTSLYVVGPDDDIEKIKADAKKEVDNVLNDIDTSGVGVSVQASTLGSLEAFISFLKKIKVPIGNVAIGPVHKKNIMSAAIMRDKDPKFAVLLAFDVKIEESAQQAANEMKIQIMSEDTIYLFEQRLKDHFGAIKDKLREETAGVCVWPCLLEVVKVFHKADPIVVGVKIKEGSLRIGTPICVPESNNAFVGTVTSIKNNDKEVTIAKKDDTVSIGIDDTNSKTTFGRHFDEKKVWFSRISRESLDSLKEAWGEELTKTDIQLLKYMKTVFKIQ